MATPPPGPDRHPAPPPPGKDFPESLTLQPIGHGARVDCGVCAHQLSGLGQISWGRVERGDGIVSSPEGQSSQSSCGPGIRRPVEHRRGDTARAELLLLRRASSLVPRALSGQKVQVPYLESA